MRQCKHCKAEFPRKGNKVFCSEACYYRFYHPLKRPWRRVCPQCDREFPRHSGNNHRWCTPECYQQSERDKREPKPPGLPALIRAHRSTLDTITVDLVAERFGASRAAAYQGLSRLYKAGVLARVDKGEYRFL